MFKNLLSHSQKDRMLHNYTEEDLIDDSPNPFVNSPYYEFSDPFLEIGSYLRQDVDIRNHENFDKVVFFLSSAWLDPYFVRNRKFCSLIPNDYLPEEKGLLILIYKLLELDENEPLDIYLLTVFCMITGRCPELLQFDPLLSQNASDVRFKAPKDITSQMGDGPCCIVPYLILLAIHNTVPCPTVYSKLEECVNGEIQEPPKVTSSLLESFQFAKREAPKLFPLSFPLSFDAGITLTNTVTRFPLKNGGYWVRVTCGPFQIAYGDDISNGFLEQKYPWENRHNGLPPPFLSDGTNPPLLEYIDNKDRCNHSENFYYGDTELLSRFCPANCPDHLESFIKYTQNLINQEKNIDNTDNSKNFDNFVILFADPQTGRLNPEKLNDIFLDDSGIFPCVVECNKSCKCKRNCICCFTSQKEKSNLMMFYSPDKNWGVAATQDIEAGSLITTYAGEIKETDPSNRNNLFYYALEFDDIDTGTGFEAIKKANIGRFINFSHRDDCFSTFSQPNARAINIVSTIFELAVIGIFAYRKIYKGEEITLDYGPHYQLEKTCSCNRCILDRQIFEKVLSEIKNPENIKIKDPENKNQKKRKRQTKASSKI